MPDHTLAVLQLRMLLAHEELRLAAATDNPNPSTDPMLGNYLGGIRAAIDDLTGRART